MDFKEYLQEKSNKKKKNKCKKNEEIESKPKLNFKTSTEKKKDNIEEHVSEVLDGLEFDKNAMPKKIREKVVVNEDDLTNVGGHAESLL